MIIYDYGGRQPNPGLPFDGAVQAWDIDNEVYHGYTTGVAVTRPFNADELARFELQIQQHKLTDLFAQVRTLIDSVAMITTTATNDSNAAHDRRVQIGTWTTNTTNLAATIRSIPSPTVAQIKEQLAVACERDVTIAGEIDNFYAWRAVVDALLMLLAQCVAGIARYVTKTPNGVG